MAQQKDQVFQLSLTEIAFTIVFILLLLLGYLVFKEESGRLAAEAALARIQTTEQATAALTDAKNNLATVLESAGTPNPDEVITNLIAADALRVERDRLKQQVVDLDAKLTTLTELQNQLEKSARSNHPDITKNEIETALVLQDGVRKIIKHESAPDEKPELQAAKPLEAHPKPPLNQRNMEILPRVKQAITTTEEFKTQLKEKLNQNLTTGREAQTVEEVVTAAKSFIELSKTGSSPEIIKKENSDLRGQVAFLKNRLDARGGRDFPPCWADENGKLEYLFSIEVKPDSVSVSPAWPQRREAAALALPEIAKLLEGPHSNKAFGNNIQGIFNWSKKQDPECRHYVYLKSSIPDAVQSDRARLMVEGYFYKKESLR
jgi:hypothetical protein